MSQRKHAHNPVGRVVDVHPMLKASAPRIATKAAPQTVADVIRASRVDEPGDLHRQVDSEYSSSEPVLVGMAPAVTPEQVRQAHRAGRTNGAYSDSEPVEVIDVLRAASAAARNATTGFPVE